jgi:MFS family permease
MFGFGVLAASAVVPLALLFLKHPPAGTEAPGARPSGASADGSVFGLRPNTVFVMLSVASFLCCIPMAMPSQHLIAFCGDLGMAPAVGPVMLSLLLTCAFLSRHFWGWLSDRIGSLLTLLICSAAQAWAVSGFLATQSEAGLFAVAAAFGLGFSGLIPAYILAARQFFPASQASWRMPAMLLTGTCGMAFGGWIAGVIYDHFGSYWPAFATGLAANLLNLVILLILVAYSRRAQRREATGLAASG